MATKKSVLVTGGAGLVGSNLVRRLAEKGERVIAYDNEFLGAMGHLDGVDCVRVKADCLDRARLARAIRDHRVDRLVHLAGYTSAPMFDTEPARKISEAHEMFVTMLDLAREHGIKIAYASTSSFYARSPKPFREDMNLIPATPYELTKYAMEQAAHTYWQSYGVVANGLRFFSVYGPHEAHKGRYANNISQFYWAIRNGVRPVVFGDGSQPRDFTYVGDLVDGIIAILADGKRSEVYNLGTGREHSFNEMIQIINEELGTQVAPEYVVNPLKNYVQETLADTGKIRADFGWRARTSLRDGIRKIIKFNEPFTRKQAEALFAWVPKPRAKKAVAK